MASVINKNPKTEVVFTTFLPKTKNKVDDFINGYMTGKKNYLVQREYRDISKDRVDKIRMTEVEKIIKENEIREIVETVLAEKEQEVNE